MSSPSTAYLNPRLGLIAQDCLQSPLHCEGKDMRLQGGDDDMVLVWNTGYLSDCCMLCHPNLCLCVLPSEKDVCRDGLCVPEWPVCPQEVALRRRAGL